MKRVVIFLLAVLMVCGLCACGADKPADTDAPADKKGCGASLGLLSVLMMSVCAAFVLKRSR